MAGSPGLPHPPRGLVARAGEIRRLVEDQGLRVSCLTGRVEHFDPTTIGVNYDPANLIIEGRESWQMGLELLGPYLDYVHAKNIAWVREQDRWRWIFASMTEGQVAWGEIISALRAVGYEGYISFENFFEVPVATTGFVGEDLTQHATTFRDIDQRLDEDLRYLKGLLAAA